MNRTERLYALAEELRAVAPRPRTARWLAARFEVCVRTIERDLAALMQAGVPIYGTRGRGGGYALDRARTLPPINVTPAEATAAAVALRWLVGTPFAAAARSLLRKLVAGMPTADARRAEDLARRVQVAGAPDTAPACAVPELVARCVSWADGQVGDDRVRVRAAAGSSDSAGVRLAGGNDPR